MTNNKINRASKISANQSQFRDDESSHKAGSANNFPNQKAVDSVIPQRRTTEKKARITIDSLNKQPSKSDLSHNEPTKKLNLSQTKDERDGITKNIVANPSMARSAKGGRKQTKKSKTKSKSKKSIALWLNIVLVILDGLTIYFLLSWIAGIAGVMPEKYLGLSRILSVAVPAFLMLLHLIYITVIIRRRRTHTKQQNVPSNQKKKPRKGIPAIVLSVIWIVAVIIIGYVVNTAFGAINNFNSGGCDEESSAECDRQVNMNKPFAIYLSGMDSYGEVEEISRSDVNQLIIVNPTQKKILIVNSPRDYFVTIHGRGPLKDKLTHAGVYGIDTSMQTVADLYGIEIDNYVKVNFTSVLDLINITGDITVESPTAFTAVDGTEFVKGSNVLNAQQALSFSRERKNLASGDNARGANQQLVMAALFKKLQEPSVAVRYQEILASLSGQFKTNMAEDSINKIIKTVLSDKYEINTIQVKGTGSMEYTYTYPNQKLYVMIPNEDSLNAAIEQINTMMENTE